MAHPGDLCMHAPAQDKATLQDRLETAINNAEGFGLR